MPGTPNGAGLALAPLSEDSEQRMSCSDPELAHAQRGGLSNSDVQSALQKVDELFPARSPGAHAAGEEDELSSTPTESRSRSGSGAVPKDPLSRHVALGRRRVDSAARPKEFTFTNQDGNCSIFRADEFDEKSFHGHRINSTALRERLDSKALDWSTVGRVQSDFAAHDKLSLEDLQMLHEKVDKAQSLHRTNSLSDAGRLYEEVLEKDPLDWDCLSNLAKIAFSKGDYQKAKELFERAVAVRPERDKTVYYLGHVLFKLRILDRAEAIFRQVSDNYRKAATGVSGCDVNTFHDSMSMLGLCLQHAGKYTEAQEVYDEVLKENSKHVQTQCHLCALKSLRGETVEAANEHAKLVALDPGHVKRVCPYLDSLFPTDSVIMREMTDMSERWDKAPKGKVPSKSLFRSIAKKLSKALRAMKGSGADKAPAGGK